jgi:hypothetical protein
MMVYMKVQSKNTAGLETPRLPKCSVVPGDLYPLDEVAAHGRPWATVRRLRDARAKRVLPVWVLGRRILVSLRDVDALLTEEPAKRGPLAGRR